MVERGADPNAQSEDDGDALYDAADHGDLIRVRQLLKRGADPNKQGGYFGNALQAATYYQSLETVKLLLEHGADPNEQGGFYGNALQATAFYGSLEIVKLLLKRGADPNKQGGEYGNALQAAAYYGSLEIVKLLLERGADPNKQGGHFDNALHAAAYDGSLEIVKLLLERGADPNEQGGFYGNALQAAARNSESLEIVKLLLERGVDPNKQGGFYGNALHAAAYGGSLETVKLLLEHGADPNEQGGFYGNALQAAAFYGSLEIVKLLLERGADPNKQGGEYGDALQAAARNGESLEIVKLLLERGVDPNKQGGEYGNALQAAAFHESLEEMKLLLKRGADPNKQGGYFGNALQAATQKGNLEMVKLLLSHNADVTIQPKSVNRRSLLHVAVASGNLAVLETLWDAGAGIHLTSQDESGSTPLHIAVDRGDVPIAKYILDHGASPDIEDLGDTNSFQLAMRKKNREMMLLLYPKTTAGLSKITASDWRLCSDDVSNCNLEMVSDQSAKVVFRDKSLERELVEMSYPLSGWTELRAHSTDFMNKHRNGKRMFILADGTMLPPQAEFSVHCRWWHLSHWDWIVRMSSAPSQNTVRQTTAEECFLECALSFNCYALPENMDLWPNDVQLEADALQEFQSRQGILWIMMKSEAHNVYAHSRNPVLESRIFFSTSEYAEIPKMATDLFCPLVLKVQSIWGQNFSRFQKHLGLMRTRILRSSGSDPSLIQYLLIDAKLLEILKENFTKQIENLQSFRDWYQNESARVLHELPPDEVKKKMQDFTKASDELQTTTGRQLSILTESSQNLIQLEFNLTSIAEAQRSTSTNKSMKRLSWITFIFLPLVFIASLFGMNVDVLKSNPAWWWYLPFATLTTLLTFVVWIVFKRNKTLEGNLETRFRWLFQRPKGEEDLEMGSESGLKGKRAKTTAFPASGKKRS